MRITALISNSLCEEISAKMREVTMAFMWGQSSGTLLSSVFCYPGAKKSLSISPSVTYSHISHCLTHLICVCVSLLYAHVLSLMYLLCLEWNTCVLCSVYCLLFFFFLLHVKRYTINFSCSSYTLITWPNYKQQLITFFNPILAVQSCDLASVLPSRRSTMY